MTEDKRGIDLQVATSLGLGARMRRSLSPRAPPALALHGGAFFCPGRGGRWLRPSDAHPIRTSNVSTQRQMVSFPTAGALFSGDPPCAWRSDRSFSAGA